MGIPLEDEVLINPSRGYQRGKVGFNKSDIVRARRLIKAGHSPEEIALEVNVQLALVQKFVQAETNYEPNAAKTEAKASDDKD